MTRGVGAQNDKGKELSFGGAAFPLPVILRSESDEESLGRCFWDGREDSSLRSE